MAAEIKDVKQSVWRFVLSGKGMASTPLSFHELSRRIPTNEIMYLSKAGIAEKKASLDAVTGNTQSRSPTHKRSTMFNIPMANTTCLFAKCRTVSSSMSFIREEVEDLDESIVSSNDGIVELHVQIGDMGVSNLSRGNFPW